MIKKERLMIKHFLIGFGLLIQAVSMNAYALDDPEKDVHKGKIEQMAKDIQSLKDQVKGLETKMVLFVNALGNAVGIKQEVVKKIDDFEPGAMNVQSKLVNVLMTLRQQVEILKNEVSILKR